MCHNLWYYMRVLISGINTTRAELDILELSKTCFVGFNSKGRIFKVLSFLAPNTNYVQILHNWNVCDSLSICKLYKESDFQGSSSLLKKCISRKKKISKSPPAYALKCAAIRNDKKSWYEMTLFCSIAHADCSWKSCQRWEKEGFSCRKKKMGLSEIGTWFLFSPRAPMLHWVVLPSKLNEKQPLNHLKSSWHTTLTEGILIYNQKPLLVNMSNRKHARWNQEKSEDDVTAPFKRQKSATEGKQSLQ